MPKKILLIILALGVSLLCLNVFAPGRASFDVPANQGLYSVQASNLQQQEQEIPTPVIAATLPVELYKYTATPGPDGYIKHTVLEAQFLFHIAELYGVDLQEILALNNLTVDSIINPGDILIIKKIELPTPEPSPMLSELQSTDTEPEETPLPFEPTPELTPTNTIVPESSQGLIERVFTNNSRYLAYAIFALVLLGVVLLIVSSRRIH